MIFIVFILLQIAGAGYLVFRSRGARLPGIALSVFTLSYAFWVFVMLLFMKGHEPCMPFH
jgi:hypothetical protein